jgi:hypothetical protein
MIPATQVLAGYLLGFTRKNDGELFQNVMPFEVGNYIIEKLANILSSIRDACNNTQRK